MRCIFRECPGTSELVGFPRHTARFEVWKKFIGKFDYLIMEVSNHNIRKRYGMCLDHFKPKWFVNGVNGKLKDNAEPSIPPRDFPEVLEKPIVFDSQKTLMKKYNNNLRTILHLNNLLEKATIPEISRNCLLLFDFLPLRDNIALVFMIRGLYENYKQLTSYSLLSTEVDSETLAVLIVNALVITLKNKFKVLGVVCPFDLRLMTALRELTTECNKMDDERNPELYEYIPFDGRRVIVIYDPPQLICAMRLEWLSMDIKFKVDEKWEVATWMDVLQVHEDQKMNDNQLLAEEHLSSGRLQKSVRHAAQVFSSRFGNAVLHYKEINSAYELPTMKSTGRFILFLNDVFDSVNGYNTEGKVNLTSSQPQFWRRTANKFKDFYLIRNNGQITKSLAGNKWHRTLHGFINLWQVLMWERFVSFIPRRVNLDPLQNDLAKMRYQVDYPSSQEFMRNFSRCVREGANYLYPKGTRFSDKFRVEQTDLDFETNPKETVFYCLPDYCTTILDREDFAEAKR